MHVITVMCKTLACTKYTQNSLNVKLMYGTKILHGIAFNGFTVTVRTIKLKSINWMEIYYIVP